MNTILLAWTLFAVELPPEVEAATAEVEALGLPEGILDEKAAEGVAKGLPPARVAAALTGMGDSLLQAQELTHSDDPNTLRAGAAALQAGAAPESVASLASANALWALGDLVRQGHEQNDALDLVEAAEAAGSDALTGLASASATMLANGQGHSAVANHLQLALGTGVSPLAAATNPGLVDIATASNAKNKDKKEKSNKGKGKGPGNGNGNGNGNGD